MIPFVVTVYPVADAYFTPTSQALCPSQYCNITNHSHVAGSTFTWIASGSSPLVTGFSSGSGNLIHQLLNNSGYDNETVTYHVLPTANGCAGSVSDGVVTIHPGPMVSLDVCFDPVTTTTAQNIKLKGGIPLGGTWSGPGITSSTFYPAIAGAGTKTITYSYTNMYTCSNVATQSIIVIAPATFSCGNQLTDIRDNQKYNTVKIGNQCWMAANLNYGNIIPSSNMQRDNCVVEKYCYNDLTGNCSSYGGLYQWDELMRYDEISAGQGLCPPGWHIPTESDWKILFDFYFSNGFAGNPLKSTGYSGYNADLVGTNFKSVNWNFIDFATFFWTSSTHGTQKGWAHAMNSYNPSVSYYPGARSNAFSVRCLKD